MSTAHGLDERLREARSFVPPTFSDTVAGYVMAFDRATSRLSLSTPNGCHVDVTLVPGTYALAVRNLGDAYADCTGLLADRLQPGVFLFCYGIWYPSATGHVIEAQYLVFAGAGPDDWVFDRDGWWIQQLRAFSDFYLRAQFRGGEVDFRSYRTDLKLTGEKGQGHRQETDTISRLVYGFASAYMLTGEERFLEAAERGTEYLRAHMRFYDRDENLVYWYHGIDVRGDRETKILASEFGDDYDAIPAYEQIYALAGPVQTYRITGDPRILDDARLTLDLFDRFYHDDARGGWFSHLDPITLDPRSPSLGDNAARKNWNSVGDHAPAYLVNLWLATADPRCARMLEHAFDVIVEHFPDYDNSPFVQERFHEDWTHDLAHGWQQNRAVVGHNLKIAWNLMRMYCLRPKPEYERLARCIAGFMPEVGMDGQRGGWYDVVERVTRPGEEVHRFAFHDRKAWWQQEQGILAYLILHGVLGGDDYHRRARESAAFYNAFFLDHDDGAVLFNVLASGVPYLAGTERSKGSHSMSGYHASELCFLAHTYTSLLVEKRPLTLHFKPRPDGFEGRVLRVAPDLLPPGAVRLQAVWIDEAPHHDFDADALTVQLPEASQALRVRVVLEPAHQEEE